MEQILDVEFAERREEALRKAKDLGDKNLQAALCCARTLPDDALRLPLLQLPDDPEYFHGEAAQIVERKFMCSELYRAALSGSAQQVQDLVAPSVPTTGAPVLTSFVHHLPPTIFAEAIHLMPVWFVA